MSRPDFTQPNPIFRSFSSGNGVNLSATGTTFVVATNAFVLFNLGRFYMLAWRFFTGQVGADAANIFMTVPLSIGPLTALAVPVFVQSSVTAGETALATILQGVAGIPQPVIQIQRANNGNWLAAETLNCMGQIWWEAPQ